MTHSVTPNAAWVFGSVPRLLAFGFGSGLIRPAPGTWGTLAGWLIWVGLLQHVPGPFMGVVLLAAFVLGCWLCQRVGAELGVPDHGGMVWDEMVAIWLVLWLSPPSWQGQLCAFVLFRVFDVIKPPPIRYFDVRLPNGFGVMLDDILAAVYSLIVMFFLVQTGWLV